MLSGKPSSNKLFSFITWFALTGMLVALTLGALWWFSNIVRYIDRQTLEQVTLVLWPTSLFLITPNADFILVLISIVGNVLLYIAIGLMFWVGFTKTRFFLAVPILSIAALWWWLLSDYRGG